MNEANVQFDSELRKWTADDGEHLGTGDSPQEAMENLQKLAGTPLAKPDNTDWITPANLP